MKYLLTILLFFFACQVEPDDIVIYTIEEGKHFCTPRQFDTADEISAMVYIDDSWLHTEVNAGWNKLIGLSDGINHLKHSNRIAWRCINCKIVFAHYVYQNGVWIAKQFEGEYRPGEWVSIEVANRGTYYAKLGTQYSYTERTGSGIGIVLLPYFGGIDTAPHDMKFVFQQL